MIKLGKLTDYAVVVMGQLAKENSTVLRSAHYLSEKTRLPEPTVAKVLKLLAQGALLESIRGAAGGYRLSRAADQISIIDIIVALEGPIAVVSCVGGGERDCRIEQSCLVKGNWTPVNDAITTALSRVRLADMIMPSCGQPGNCTQAVSMERIGTK